MTEGSLAKKAREDWDRLAEAYQSFRKELAPTMS